MKKTLKITGTIFTVISLFVLLVVPTFAATTYSTKYSTNQIYYYNNSTYTTRTYYQSPVIKPPTPTPTQPQVPVPSTPAPVPTPQPTTGLSTEESKMVNLVNQARIGQGIKPLSVNQQLATLARKKSQDMVTNNYFSHNSPTYGSPFDMMKSAGVTYRTAGENIAGASTTETAHQNLMNSPGHKANILNTNFTEVGIGIVKGSAYGNIFTQMFIGR